MADWLEPQPISVPEALHEVVGGHPLVAEALVRRGITDPEQARAFLDPARYHPAPPDQMPGLPQAVQRVQRAIERGEAILVWGDFDVDGLTSTAILVEALRSLGAHVSYHVPGRGEGHGVHLAGLKQHLSSGSPPRLVVTCDTGIGAAAVVAYGRGVALDFVITDHHVPPPELPAAEAVVNPCFLPAAHPLRTLPGAGCAYLLAAALGEALGWQGCKRSLDLLALAIVADVATLQGDARYYLQRGLLALRAGERLGLQALCEVAGVERAGLDEEHLGFALGPRLNALGRLSDASQGLELFLTDDLIRARSIASEMEGLNNRRQLLTSQVLQAAREQLERDPAALRAPAIIVAHPSWPGGILGLVAGRLAEHYGKPAIVLANPPGENVRGSARSVPGVDIAGAIAAAGDLLTSHGGHPMAAGLSLPPENLPEFRRRLQAEVGRQAAVAPPPPPLAIDAFLPLDAVTPELAQDLNRLAPFGPGNPPVQLAARRLRVAAQAAIGRTGEHRRLVVRDEAGREQKVFWWQAGDSPAPEGVFDLAFTIRPTNYQGVDEATVTWLAVRPVEAPAPEVAERAPGPHWTVFDHREDPAPTLALETVRAQEQNQAALLRMAGQGSGPDNDRKPNKSGSPDFAPGPLLIWAEGKVPAGLPTVDRTGAAPAEALALWTAPPGPRELARLLQQVQPQRIHLFALDPGQDEPGAFLRRLAGLVKYALAHYGGEIDAAQWERLAAATAQRLGTVQSGVRWLAAQGQIIILEEGAARWRIGAGAAAADAARAAALGAELMRALRETAAYRAYCRVAEPHILLASEC